MKHKTYNNVMKLAKIISKKGYDIKESAEIAVKCFDNAEGSIYSPEHFADMIITKEQWEREHNVNRQ
jgi:hypothetical protein